MSEFFLFNNRPLNAYERSKLHELELEVVVAFEQITGLTFMRFDVPLLKKCIQNATPGAIIGLIKTYYRKYPQNFKDFNYIVRPIVQGVLKKSRGAS